jgi:hypothetical protein
LTPAREKGFPENLLPPSPDAPPVQPCPVEDIVGVLVDGEEKDMILTPPSTACRAGCQDGASLLKRERVPSTVKACRFGGAAEGKNHFEGELDLTAEEEEQLLGRRDGGCEREAVGG